jgi:hypothetical protein
VSEGVRPVWTGGVPLQAATTHPVLLGCTVAIRTPNQPRHRHVARSHSCVTPTSGGEDLKFPHHDNELAQAEAYYHQE